ncbi:MAG: hypothetical protein ACFCVK_23865 [Acidimicrobiales bacterium]
MRASVSRGEREGSSGSGCSWASVDESGGTGDGRASGAQTTASADGLTTLALYRRVCTSGTSLVWVPLVTATDLLPALRDEMVRRLHHPAPVFEPFDDELGWVYVSVPIDVRTEAATWEPIVLTASIDGPPGLAPWVTLTATPVELLFSSGDPTDPGVVARCGGDAAVAAYVADAPGACSYTWYNASTTVAGDVFAAEMGIAWEVTYASSDGPGSLDVEPTVTPVPVQVAEIKALVTCTGPDPAQGGC